MWCGQTGKPNHYVLPLKNGRRTFCSEACLFEFRKGACVECGDAVQGTPVQLTDSGVLKDFCSDRCLETYAKKDARNTRRSSGSAAANPVRRSPDCPLPSTLPANSFLAGPGGTFSWDDYLKETNSVAAPQSCFKQVCLWKNYHQLNFIYILIMYILCTYICYL